MKISDNQKNYLKNIIPNVDVMISKNDIDGILNKSADVQIEFGFTEDQEWLNPLGLELQKIYDEIYCQNE